MKQSFAIRNVSSHDLSVLGLDPATGRPRRHIMIPRNSPLPCKRASLFKTAQRDQKSVAVRVVEGGTDAGQGATQIGKCVAQGLPADLPKGTEVKVIFKYGTDGRLAVRAELPTVSCDATTVIERAIGMSREQFETWSKRLATGLIIEVIDPAEEPLDVSDIESLLDEDDELVEVSDSQSTVEDDSESTRNESEATADPNTEQGTGDKALDDFLKRIG